MKYWLTELGYDVYLSENSDFPRDAKQNTYETCISTINECDWFILLIGNRVGGILIDEETSEEISITQKEYRTAYKLFQEGKIKKIINFVRDEVWQEKELRKNLAKNISENSSQIIECSTKSIEDPKKIFSFIDEVRRINDIKSSNGQINTLPKGNWINVFKDFSDIINTITIELNINRNVSDLIWKANLKREFIENLSKIIVKNKEKIFNFYDILTPIRDNCINQLKANNRSKVVLNMRDFNLMCITYPNAITINCTVLKEALLSGFFLKFNPKENLYESTQLDEKSKCSFGFN